MNFINKNLNSNKSDSGSTSETELNIGLFGILTFLMHLVYLVHYLVSGTSFFVYINIFCMVVIFIGLVMNKKNKYDLCADIISMDIIVYSIITTCLTGWNTGLQWFIAIIVIAHYLFFETNNSKKIFYSIMAVISYNFILVWLFYVDPIFINTNIEFLKFINVNLFMMFLLFILNIVSIRNLIIKENYENKLYFAEKISYTDVLTNVWNRRYLDTIKDDLIISSRNSNIKISIGMIDIDDFKWFNDSYGHDFGDRVLKELTSKMVNSFRKSDIIIRYGGEEFIIIMENIDEHTAYKIIDRFRINISQNPILKFEKEDILINFTCGVAELNKYDTFNEALQIADKRMYRGKKSGKNKVIYSD